MSDDVSPATKKPAVRKTAAATGTLATAAVAAVTAFAALPDELSAELTRQITAGGLTVNAVVTAVAVWFIARHRNKIGAKITDLRGHIDHLNQRLDAAEARLAATDNPDTKAP